MIKPKKPKRIKNNIRFKNAPKYCSNKAIGDFWEWGFSDLLQNTTRGVLAEYIVAFLLGIDKEPRNPWDAYDLKLKEGRTIEIKTMSKLQAWVQKKLSDPKVVLAPTRKWDPKTGITEKLSTFNAGLYIFCYFKADNHKEADPLNLKQWEFFIFTKKQIKKILSGQKSISLKRILGLGIEPIYADNLKKEVLKLK